MEKKACFAALISTWNLSHIYFVTYGRVKVNKRAVLPCGNGVEEMTKNGSVLGIINGDKLIRDSFSAALAG
jgi:hypothetical protein